MSDPREPIIRRLAERLGVPVETIAENRPGGLPPLIAVDMPPGPLECAWRARLVYTPDRITIAIVEINADGTVTYLGDPPHTWKPALTISPTDLAAALAAASRDLEELFHDHHTD